ncbi:PREDICTED: WPP domain-containing protein 1-like [Camelina sativa]|uniref:WPP domain-containing protein 1-like n=1 Tax=Camelina sativa TaxID=90675 RepID=A0ABM0UJI9_CAMSA|nr:PREDICTED: WPP domain-containing protein 1-like [Camelina sativa]
MAEADTTTTSPPQIPESETSTTLPTTEKKDSNNETEKNPNPGTISLRIWPPTQKTRDAVVKRLTETLSTESILSKRYGTLDSEEASSVARSIEDEAHAVASAAVVGDDDGIEVLKVYSKEISKHMLESMKAKKTPAPKAGGGGGDEEEETELAAELGSVKLDEDKA